MKYLLIQILQPVQPDSKALVDVFIPRDVFFSLEDALKHRGELENSHWFVVIEVW